MTTSPRSRKSSCNGYCLKESFYTLPTRSVTQRDLLPVVVQLPVWCRAISWPGAGSWDLARMLRGRFWEAASDGKEFLAWPLAKHARCRWLTTAVIVGNDTDLPDAATFGIQETNLRLRRRKMLFFGHLDSSCHWSRLVIGFVSGENPLHALQNDGLIVHRVSSLGIHTWGLWHLRASSSADLLS